MAKIVLMGDSITEYMPYIYKGNIGKSGDEIKYFGIENIGVGRYMKYVWPKIDHDNVDVYILLIGTNNISRPDCDYDDKETLDDLIDKLKEFINTIIISSSSRLLVQSIYPTKHPKRNEEIILVNEKIESYCNDIGVEYLDLYSLLKDDEGLFDKRYSDDGIHPNLNGYTLIAEELNKRIINTKKRKKRKLQKN